MTTRKTITHKVIFLLRGNGRETVKHYTEKDLAILFYQGITDSSRTISARIEAKEFNKWVTIRGFSVVTE